MRSDTVAGRPAEHPPLQETGLSGAPTLTEREFALFQGLIYREAGIHLAAAKRLMVARRLGGRLRELGLRSFAGYYRVVSGGGDPEERVRMLDRITTNETRFFREPRQFEYLEEQALPRWRSDAAEGRRHRRVRVWSAGCSTGEEPYSLAMLLLEGLPPGEGWQIEILATDLSRRVIEAARAAVWPIERAEDIPRRYRERYMLKGTRVQTGRMAAGAELRSLVRFQRVNLNEEPCRVAGPFDLILCRNVLIYFDVASKQRVVDRLLDRLQPDGYFMVGHAESLNPLTTRVRSVMPTVFTLSAENPSPDTSPRICS